MYRQIDGCRVYPVWIHAEDEPRPDEPPELRRRPLRGSHLSNAHPEFRLRYTIRVLRARINIRVEGLGPDVGDTPHIRFRITVSWF